MKARPHIPEIAGDWRLLFRPEKTGCYVNDHSIVRTEEGRWHLFGITSLNKHIDPEHERYFVHARGASLEEGLGEERKTIDHGTRAWAPGVAAANGRYYMYYGPAPTKLAVSNELFHWINNDIALVGSPIDACHRDHMVVQINEYTWAMYATGVRPGGYGCISVYVSNDLQNWRFVQYALTTSGEAPLRCAWGATESPYVVFYEGFYYLFITYTDCSDETYNDTLVFRSANPYDFGDYRGEGGGAQPVAKLFGHASEVIRDPESGTWYMTTCGWPGKGAPHEGGVSIAKIIWKPEE
ncbi:MAG TPA: hypothetical protein VEZ72_20815 [Paenibacillus sp.]|nr:hypothetical protein [Paenibacillus sp.]